MRTRDRIVLPLVVGKETVKTHMGSILRKLGLRNRTQLARVVPRASGPPSDQEAAARP